MIVDIHDRSSHERVVTLHCVTSIKRVMRWYSSNDPDRTLYPVRDEEHDIPVEFAVLNQRPINNITPLPNGVQSLEVNLSSYYLEIN